MITIEQINLFKIIFKGREDVFAVRWEKRNKSGYMPACPFDPYFYRMHKSKDGNLNDKIYLTLTNNEIEKHLNGQQFIGIYPLLKDNTSWFIAADFDKENWEKECLSFTNACKENEIPAYLERSRSGKGGHVWIFFEKPYPAIKSRKIIISILEKSGVFSMFDKSSSFDRLFPNQDFLSGKGFGNLIALPLNKENWIKGNNCFIDTETFQPYADQWEFLKNIKRISISELDKLYSLSGITNVSTIEKENINKDILSDKLIIKLDNNVSINRIGLSIKLINYLKEELNFINSEFLIKKKLGKNTFEEQRYFKFVEEIENSVLTPRGFIGKLLRFCKENNIAYEFLDKRKKLDNVSFSSTIELKENQKHAFEATSKKDIGVIVSPPGSGKTIIGLKIIAEKQQSALIVVHRKQIAEQWIERIQAFLGIPKNEIGRIGNGKTVIGKKITVAMIQSLTKELEKPECKIQNSFGTILVDECHHVPAETFRNTIAKLHTYYLYGLTATPFRKYNDGKLIFIHLGEIIAELKPQDISNQQKVKIIIRNTELDVPFNSRTDNYETLSKVLVHDSARNKLILKDVIFELNKRRKVVIITERKEHIDALYQYLKQSYEAITLSGDDSEISRVNKWKTLKTGNYQVLITTGQLFGEGTDLQNAECLFLVYPFSFKGKLIQYIGRVQRSEVIPTIYDYRDLKIDYLNKLFLKRNTYYRKIEKEASLFDEQEEIEVKAEATFVIEKQIKVSIEELEFRYGSFAFKYEVTEIKTTLDFEIENLEIRPEFEVLKPYFSKLLKSQNVKIDIHAEFQNEKLVSQLATSTDLENINQEIIESVKFRFISKNFIGKINQQNEVNSMLDLKGIQEGNNIFSSEEELFENILKNKNFKHYKHLRHLAQKHENTILKIRFVLNPFSFVFLLKGNEQNHLVLETLDTEEATYIWHFNKDFSIHHKLNEIDKQLNIIRNKGRQAFLDTQPENFSRILHDYSDERKGFIIWKDLLEERLA